MIRVKNRAKSLQMVQANLAEHRRTVPDFLTLIEGAIPEGRVRAHARGRRHFDPRANAIDHRALLAVIRAVLAVRRWLAIELPNRD